MTAALVEFRFPDDTRFPCLPVRASNGRGLVYPLEGSSWCTGPELVVAGASGAIIRVQEGYRIDWIEGSIRLFEDITRKIGEIRRDAKRETDVVLDKLAKEVGNSIYGKLAQAVASTRIIKDDIEWRRAFNSTYGETDKMGPSAITNAPMAAYCTGLVRALLRRRSGNCRPRRGPDRQPPTAFCPYAVSAMSIKAGRWRSAFKAVRTRITPGDDTIWELKHQIPRALVTKTRGTYTVAPEGWDGWSVVLAKAGYMTPEEVKDQPEIEQCRRWIESYRERDFETRMRAKSLTSMRSNICLRKTSRWWRATSSGMLITT